MLDKSSPEPKGLSVAYPLYRVINALTWRKRASRNFLTKLEMDYKIAYLQHLQDRYRQEFSDNLLFIAPSRASDLFFCLDTTRFKALADEMFSIEAQRKRRKKIFDAARDEFLDTRIDFSRRLRPDPDPEYAKAILGILKSSGLGSQINFWGDAKKIFFVLYLALPSTSDQRAAHGGGSVTGTNMVYLVRQDKPNDLDDKIWGAAVLAEEVHHQLLSKRIPEYFYFNLMPKAIGSHFLAVRLLETAAAAYKNMVLFEAAQGRDSSQIAAFEYRMKGTFVEFLHENKLYDTPYDRDQLFLAAFKEACSDHNEIFGDLYNLRTIDYPLMESVRQRRWKDMLKNHPIFERRLFEKIFIWPNGRKMNLSEEEIADALEHAKKCFAEVKTTAVYRPIRQHVNYNRPMHFSA
jgi:hypothetical protein